VPWLRRHDVEPELEDVERTPFSTMTVRLQPRISPHGPTMPIPAADIAQIYEPEQFAYGREGILPNTNSKIYESMNKSAASPE